MGTIFSASFSLLPHPEYSLASFIVQSPYRLLRFIGFDARICFYVSFETNFVFLWSILCELGIPYFSSYITPLIISFSTYSFVSFLSFCIFSPLYFYLNPIIFLSPNRDNLSFMYFPIFLTIASVHRFLICLYGSFVCWNLIYWLFTSIIRFVFFLWIPFSLLLKSTPFLIDFVILLFLR